MIFNYDSIEHFLSDELRRRVQLNPRYSLRAYAKNLKLSPGALSEILRGKRELSLKSVPNVAKAFGLNADEGRHLLRLALKDRTYKNEALQALERAASQKRNNHELSGNLFALVSEWYHFAILNLLDCDRYEWSSTWISDRLGISRIQARLAMDLLLKLGLVVKNNGRWVSRHENVEFASQIPSAAVREFHRQILQKAVAAIDGQSLDERELSGCGFAVDQSHLMAIKKEIGQFQERLIAKYGKGKKTEVYFLEMVLFKITQEKGNKS
jgi:uncharacterized protein (TIGR02147 family)